MSNASLTSSSSFTAKTASAPFGRSSSSIDSGDLHHLRFECQRALREGVIGELCMRIKYFSSGAGLSLALVLAACGGGGGGGGGGAAPSGGSPPVVEAPKPVVISAAEASRLAKQASFGPTQALIDHIVALKSASAWIDEQMGLSGSTYADIAAKPVATDYCTALTGDALTNCNRDNFTALPMAMRFYANALGNDDQLRQRVAFALSQIVVASDLEVHTTAGLATFNQILLSNAFGNYRDILAQVSLNPFMGDYLDMVDSNKSSPNENYARELMQLFSVGTVLLNQDGTTQTGADGAVIATYSGAEVKDVARALTGWTYARLDGAAITDGTKRDMSKPMIQVASRFDTGSKTFLGTTVPASATQQQNVDAVVDAVFNHANTAPFVSKRLIQQLVLANPSPAYVGRVAAVFANNGSGVRGDMKAVIKAILTDSEARGAAPTPGKVKEPVLFLTSIGRGLGLKTDGYAFYYRDNALGQMPFRASSVFNFYPYDFPLPLGDGQVSPVSKLMTTSTVIARHNLAWDWSYGEQTRTEFKVQAAIPGATGSTTAWTDWEALAADESKLLDRLDLVFLNGTMTSAQRSALSSAMAAIKNSDPTVQAHKRAQVALYIVTSSPQFQVDR
jgi:uncharacterized protein (DUF1800 family)